MGYIIIRLFIFAALALGVFKGLQWAFNKYWRGTKLPSEEDNYNDHIGI